MKWWLVGKHILGYTSFGTTWGKMLCWAPKKQPFASKGSKICHRKAPYFHVLRDMICDLAAFRSRWFVCGLHFTYWSWPQRRPPFLLIKAQHDGANQRASFLTYPSSASRQPVVSSISSVRTCQHIVTGRVKDNAYFRSNSSYHIGNLYARIVV